MKRKISTINWRANLKDKEIDSIDEDLFLFTNPLLLLAFEYPVKMDISLTLL